MSDTGKSHPPPPHSQPLGPEAVRAILTGNPELGGRALETWKRYRQATTELIHLGEEAGCDLVNFIAALNAMLAAESLAIRARSAARDGAAGGRG